ncbi:MAG: guanylate kinase [Lautropia sp.]|nr:guanylate kinase [Lautropia sp.]
MSSPAGTILIVVAPSGAGKTSLVRALMEARNQIRHSVSFTTRAPRLGEQNGEDYCFISEAEFRKRRIAGEFLEWAEVHGNLYGTSRRWIDEQTAAGADIVLEIDWQGARQVRSLYPEAVSIFIAPPSLAILELRLQARGKDSPEVIELRLAAARNELQHAAEFQYIIVNQEFTEACRQLLCIADAARCRFRQQAALQPGLFAALGIPAE